MKNILIYISIIVFASGCEKKTEWPLDTVKSDLIIVDGNITNEHKTQVIKLTHPLIRPNETPRPVTGATVVISDEYTSYQLAETPVNSGIYKTNNSFAGHIGNTYTLLINYNNTIYTAKSLMLPGNGFSVLKYEQNTNNDLYYITWVAGNYNPQHSAMFEILLDWSTVAGYDTLPADSCKARLLYYTLSTIDVSEVFAPEKQKIYFPAGTLIQEKKYSLTPEHAEFIRALLSETNWSGGLFDCAHANLPTNLSEGAAGFFGACAVDSLWTPLVVAQ